MSSDLFPWEFDPDAVEPSVPLDPVPAGKYPAMIVDSEVDQNSKKTGMIFKYTMEIIEGPYKGRKIFGNINLTHNNPEAEKIGQGDLSALFKAAKVGKTNNSMALRNRPVLITVIYVPAEGNYRAKNDIKGFEPIAANGAQRHQAAPAQQQLPPQTDSSAQTTQQSQPTGGPGPAGSPAKTTAPPPWAARPQ